MESQNKNILRLTIKKKWFDMIASGEKKEEYREIKPYWERRFNPIYGNKTSLKPASSLYPNSMQIESVGRKWDFVEFINGYSKTAPRIMVECLGIETGKAKSEWSDNWQGDVFIIKLG